MVQWYVIDNQKKYVASLFKKNTDKTNKKYEESKLMFWAVLFKSIITLFGYYGVLVLFWGYFCGYYFD